ncbi:MAG: cob(I)yrinic acid a,c-diamide adenosyltransferase [Selenomonadaceae bacterium]|nr:cob(I)yrinic acid a,c-diamide adenosyltransferase [Selenomonadaceae bacterium]
MSICTKTGDDGTTSLYTGERVPKNSLRVQVYGIVDEATSALAMGRAFARHPEVKQRIYKLQKLMSILMADLASLNQPPRITDAIISELETEIDSMEAALPKLTAFIIPGDSQAGAFLDLARTISRRAEREFLNLSQNEETHKADGLFLNRLSDYCFMLMRIEDTMANSASNQKVNFSSAEA